jgi:hypothetical protein
MPPGRQGQDGAMPFNEIAKIRFFYGIDSFLKLKITPFKAWVPSHAPSALNAAVGRKHRPGAC